MAPMQNKSCSSSKHKSSSNWSSSGDSGGHHHRGLHHKSSFDDDWDSFVPVTRRGRPFFQDSFFESTRSHFDDAVRDALRKFGSSSFDDDDDDFFSDSRRREMPSSSRHSNLNRYRQMRNKKDLGNIDDNLAVTVTSDNTLHKIVLDVHDFVEGDLKVKVVGDRDILVEGRTEKKKQGAPCSEAIQTFSRKFPLPEDVDMTAIDSVMSSDGILTITAPKVHGRLGSSAHQQQFEKSRSSSSSSFNRGASSTRDDREPCDCENCHPVQHSQEKVYHAPIQRPDQPPVNSGSNTYNESSNSREERNRGKAGGCHEEKCLSNSNTDYYEEPPFRAFFNSRPITRRGRFFDDAFFEDTRGHYRTAIQDVLEKWGDGRAASDRSSSNMDDLTSYRNLRKKDLRDDNQAVKTVEDEFQHKFILDVHDFTRDGEVNIKAVDDKELIVEGVIEKKDGPNISMKRFTKRFNLPDDVHLESVSSVMSLDGVLTIIAPKKHAVLNASMETEKITHDDSKTYQASEDSSSQFQKKSTVVESHESCGDFSSKDYSDDQHKIINTEEEKEQVNLQSSMPSKDVNSTYSEEKISSVGRNITINVDEADEAELQSHSEGEGKALSSSNTSESITVQENSTKESTTGDLSVEQHKARRDSLSDDTDEEIRKVREYRGSSAVRFEDESEDDLNQDYTDKKGRRSSLRPSDALYDDDEDELEMGDGQRRGSRRSSANEDTLNISDRLTPSRDYKKGGPLAPLNPNAKRKLPISTAGHFSSDSYFNDFQRSYRQAIGDVLSMFKERSSGIDDITAYRNMRLRDPKLENQAYHVDEEEGVHRITLDVKDFLSGEIEASLYGESDIVIEGYAERIDGNQLTKLTFLRRFPLPENADADAIAVVMSSDGVLTVLTPWKGYSGLSAIKNILAEDRPQEDRPPFSRISGFDSITGQDHVQGGFNQRGTSIVEPGFERPWDDSTPRASSAFNDRIRSRLRHNNDHHKF